MKYAVKLIDSLLQLLVFTGGLVVLSLFGLSGYFYWALVLLLCWIPMSSLLHVILRYPVSVFRWIMWGLIALIVLIFSFSYLTGTTFSQLNFYFYQSVVPIVLLHLILNLAELVEHRKGGKDYLDF
jgi:multisubunit Na+/H+ antiporter MnhB subunit